jgi:hypothetical protein
MSTHPFDSCATTDVEASANKTREITESLVMFTSRDCDPRPAPARVSNGTLLQVVREVTGKRFASWVIAMIAIGDFSGVRGDRNGHATRVYECPRMVERTFRASVSRCALLDEGPREDQEQHSLGRDNHIISS